MEKEELRRIGVYTKRLAAGPKMTLLTDGERLELRDLLKRWLAEVEEERIRLGVPTSWGDVRKIRKAQ